jgi:hypothetical protein
MSGDETAHMRWLRRVLGGEVVNNEVGIRLRGGPFDGRIRIMPLDGAGSPPLRVRGRRSVQVWHVYVLAAEPAEASSWIYLYEGDEPVEAPTSDVESTSVGREVVDGSGAAEVSSNASGCRAAGA